MCNAVRCQSPGYIATVNFGRQPFHAMALQALSGDAMYICVQHTETKTFADRPVTWNTGGCWTPRDTHQAPVLGSAFTRPYPMCPAARRRGCSRPPCAAPAGGKSKHFLPHTESLPSIKARCSSPMLAPRAAAFLIVRILLISMSVKSTPAANTVNYSSPASLQQKALALYKKGQSQK